MQKCLYLLCPTDCLETVINNAFEGKNYFYTSLGNSVRLNNETLDEIACLILKHNLKEISFILSDENDIIYDALGNQDLLEIRGLGTLYYDIVKQKEASRMLSYIGYNQFSIISYYLNSKIKVLQSGLKDRIRCPIKINGKVYINLKKSFRNVYPDLICLTKHSLN